MGWDEMGWDGNQGPMAKRPLCAELAPFSDCTLMFLVNWVLPGSPFPIARQVTKPGEGADNTSGGWHWSQAICSQLPSAWAVAARPQPAPAPLTSHQRALTLSLCVLSNLPNIAAWSLSTVLFHAYFPSPEDAKSAVPSLHGCISCQALPSP